jgi:hypothetical protein
MPRRCTRVAFLLAGALSLALPAGATRARSAAPQKLSGAATEAGAKATEEARAALREMSAALSSARTLQFRVRNLVPMKEPGGEWITLVGGASVKRQGKDKLFVQTSGDLYPFSLYFDGKTLVAHAPGSKVYAKREEPGTVDEMLERSAKNGEAAFVFRDLISSDPYAAMTKGLESARVVGTSTLDGVETRHLAVHGQKLDWEIWIGTNDRLPRLVTLTDTADARKPTHTVQLYDWALDQPIPPDAFSFNVPADTKQVPFRNPAQAKAAARHGPPPASRP